MFRARQLRVSLLVLAGVFCATVLIPHSRASAQQDDPVLKLIPADSLACLRINDLDGTLMQTDQFLAGVSPVGVTMFAKMGLGRLLGNPMLAGVDTGGSFAVFVSAGPAQGGMPMPSVAGLIPMSDFQQFIGSNPNSAQPDADGLVKLSGQGTPELLTCSLGSYALIGLASDRDAFLALKKKISAKPASLAGLVDSVQAEEAKTMPLWLFCNMQEVNKAFGPLIKMQLQQAKAMMQQVKAQGQMPEGVDPSKFLDMYLAVFDTILKETMSVSVSVKPTSDALLLSKSVKALPGSSLAKMLPASSGKGFNRRLLGYLSDGAALTMTMRMSMPAWMEMNGRMLDWLAVGFGDSISQQDAEKMKAMMADAADAIGESAVFSLIIDEGAKPPMAMEYVLEVKDAAKLNALIDRGHEMFNGIWGGLYKSMGMEIDFTLKRAIAKHRGVSIDSAELSMKMTDKTLPQAAMINSMYSDGLSYRWANTDKLALYAMGSQADVRVKKMIDKALDGGDSDIPVEMKAVMSLLPQAKQASTVTTLNLLRFRGMIKAMAPVPLPDVPSSTKSNIVIASKCDSGRFSVDVAVPKAHVVEIRDVILGIMMQNNSTQQ